MNPLARLARRGQRPAPTSGAGRLGGADAGPGALSTLELPPALAAGTTTAVLTAPAETTSRSTPASADPYAADRFTVDPAEWARAGAPAPQVEPPSVPTGGTVSPWRLFGRLVLVTAIGLVAFHHSLASLFRTVAQGSILVYVLTVPLFAGLAAAAAIRRPRWRAAGRVRAVDVVVGAVLCTLAIALTTLVGPGLSGVYFVWRLDLLMLWLFSLGGNLMTFGARQVARTWAFWAVLVLIWPFPMRLVNAAAGSALGGTVMLVVVVLAVLGYGHRAGDPARWKVLGSTALAAAVVLAACGVATHPERIIWPPVVAVLVGSAWWVTHSAGPTNRPVAEHRVRGTVPALAVLGVVALVVLPVAPLPAPISSPTSITSLATGPLEIPGWATMTSESLQEQRFFGNQSSWQRVGLRQGVSGVGPEAGGRDIVVDLMTTPRPQTLDLYPVVTTYPMGTLSATPDDEVDLGHGVRGQLFRGTDAEHHLGYTLLTFSWKLPVDMSIVGPYQGPPAQVTQRLTLIAVDDHDGDATFPRPGNATLDGFGAAFASVWSDPPPRDPLQQADARLLTDAARALVDQRLTGR